MSDALHIVCPECRATNRIPRGRLKDGPNCGKCHEPLFARRVVDLSDASFQKHINRNDIPIVVDFWAPWCGPCKAMAPSYAKAAASLEPHVRLAKLNTEDQQQTAAQFGIRSIPTLILFRGGREVARHSGAMMEGDIIRWVSANTAQA